MADSGRIPLMTHHAPPARLRMLIPAVLAAAVVLSLAACSSSDDPEGIIETSWALEFLTGTDLRGVNVDLRHGSDLTVSSVTPIGPFAAASCEQNVTAGQVRLSCAVTTDTDAPFDGWNIVFRHEASVRPEQAVTSIACQGSLADGSTLGVTCDID